MSAFNYNTYGATNIESVAKIVFTNDNYVSKELSRKTRPNAPPDAVNYDMLESIREGPEDEVATTDTKKSAFQGPIDYKKAA